MKYRKKPVVVEAFQFDGDFMYQTGEYYVPDWAVKALDSGMIVFDGPNGLIIKTLEGEMRALAGDFIIKGVLGEFYPCKEFIFHETYDEIK